MTSAGLSPAGETLTVNISLRIRQRGGRKLMLAPDGSSTLAPPRARVDSAIVKAVARAYRWRHMLEGGAHASITDLATAEKINLSYICRVLRLTLLAPDIVDAMLDGRQSARCELKLLLKPFPVEWPTQRRLLCREDRPHGRQCPAWLHPDQPAVPGGQQGDPGALRERLPVPAAREERSRIWRSGW